MQVGNGISRSSAQGAAARHQSAKELTGFLGGALDCKTVVRGFVKRSRVLQIAGLAALWTALGALGYIHSYLQQTDASIPAHFWSALSLWLCCYWAWMPLTPLIVLLERRFPLERESLYRHLAVIAASSVIFSYAAFDLGGILRLVACLLEGLPLSEAGVVWGVPSLQFLMEQWLFWSVIAVACVLRKFRELHARRQEAARFVLENSQLEATLRKTELEALRMRLNPHFLFNSLQNISVLAQQDPRTASRMISRLGELLRASFRRDFQAEVPLSVELELTRAYFDIEKMRFRDSLQVQMDIQPGTELAYVPSLLLQPIVENAIVHGLAGFQSEGKVSVRSLAENGRLILLVEDSGPGFPVGAPPEFEMGVGLGSTYERLRRMYPGQHELVVEARASGGTQVRVSLPLRVNAAAASISHEPASIADCR